VMYDLAVGPFLGFNPPGAAALLLAADVNGSRVVRRERDVPSDNVGDDQQPLKTRIRTTWVDMDQPALPKRWKRPEILLAAGTGAEVFVKGYRDWDPTVVSRNFTLNASEPDEQPVKGDGWGSLWGQFKWSRSR